MAFIDEIKERARAEKKRIILPEGMDRRVWEVRLRSLVVKVTDKCVFWKVRTIRRKVEDAGN